MGWARTRFTRVMHFVYLQANCVIPGNTSEGFAASFIVRVVSGSEWFSGWLRVISEW